MAALAAAPNGPIAVIATEGTVKGGAYRARHPCAMARHASGAAGLPALRADGGRRLGRRANRRGWWRSVISTPLLATMPRPRALVLGCTHFPVFKDVIARVAGPRHRAGRQRGDDGGGSGDVCWRNAAWRGVTSKAPPHFLATDAPDRFARVGEIFLGGADRSGNGGTDRPSIIHPHQIKPVGRRDGAAAAAVARFQRLGHIARTGHLPSPTSFSVPTIERT